MTTDEESLDGGSSVKIELVLARVVARFHAWKFGAKAEKRGALKVSNAGKVKKQKTPIKTSVHGALEARGQEEMDAMLNQTKNVKEDLMEVATLEKVTVPKSEPEHAHREQ
jgi:hypothetical protein